MISSYIVDTSELKADFIEGLKKAYPLSGLDKLHAE